MLGSLSDDIKWAGLLEAVRDEYEKRETIISEWRIRDFAAEPFVVYGTMSAASKTKRWIRPSAVISVGGLPTTMGSLVRTWLRQTYRLPLRRKADQIAEAERYLKAHSMPLYAVAGWQGEALYLDISSAYLQIASAIGWDVDVSLTRNFLSVRRLPPLPLGLYESKLARALLYSLAYPSLANVVRYGRVSAEALPAPYRNPLFCMVVMLVLRSVAFDLITVANAVYVHTDGAIIPVEYLPEALAVYDTWGLVVSEKARGDAIVYGVGSYRVGQRASATIQKGGRSYTNIHRFDAPEWFIREFSRFAVTSPYYRLRR